MKQKDPHYKEICGRLLFVVEDVGWRNAPLVILTAGHADTHVHQELNTLQAKRLHKWLGKFIKRQQNRKVKKKS